MSAADLAEDAARLLGDLAGALWARRGEAGTMDLTRVPAARPETKTAREGKK